MRGHCPWNSSAVPLLHEISLMIQLRTECQPEDGGNNFLELQANFRFEQKGQQPTNSKGINMLENPMHSPHLFLSLSSVGRFPDLGARPGQRHWPCPDRGDRSGAELKSGVCRHPDVFVIPADPFAPL